MGLDRRLFFASQCQCEKSDDDGDDHNADQDGAHGGRLFFKDRRWWSESAHAEIVLLEPLGPRRSEACDQDALIAFSVQGDVDAAFLKWTE